MNLYPNETKPKSELTSVSLEDLGKINIPDYMPSNLSAVYYYHMYNQNGEVGGKIQMACSTVSRPTKDKLRYYYLAYSSIGNSAPITLKGYYESDFHSVRHHVTQTALGSTPNDTGDLIICSQQIWQEVPNVKSDACITASKITVATAAGKFDNCIEVTSINPLTDSVIDYDKDYYAPGVGLILKRVKNSQTKNAYINFQELVKYEVGDPSRTIKNQLSSSEGVN